MKVGLRLVESVLRGLVPRQAPAGGGSRRFATTGTSELSTDARAVDGYRGAASGRSGGAAGRRPSPHPPRRTRRSPALPEASVARATIRAPKRSRHPLQDEAVGRGQREPVALVAAGERLYPGDELLGRELARERVEAGVPGGRGGDTRTWFGGRLFASVTASDGNCECNRAIPPGQCDFRSRGLWIVVAMPAVIHRIFGPRSVVFAPSRGSAGWADSDRSHHPAARDASSARLDRMGRNGF